MKRVVLLTLLAPVFFVMALTACRPEPELLHPRVVKVEVKTQNNETSLENYQRGGAPIYLKVTVTTVDGASKRVDWSIAGNASPSTDYNFLEVDKNQENPVLTIAPDESNDIITITARSRYDPSKEGSFTVSLAEIRKDDLRNAIEAANNLKAGVQVNTDGTKVPVGTYWVDQHSMDAFEAAIGTASSIYASQNPTPYQITQAAHTLNEATAAFLAVRQVGVQLNKQPLIEAVAAANALHSQTTANTNSNNVEKGKWWAPEADITAYRTAIDTATEVMNKLDAELTQEAVNTATQTLIEKTALFNTKRHEGAYVPPADKTGLNNAINEAIVIRNETLSAAGAGYVEEGKFWVPSTVWTAFDTLIKAAQNVSSAQGKTQAEVNAETYKLKGDSSAVPGSDAHTGAIEVFKTARLTGTLVVWTSLDNAISAAASAKNQTAVSALNGTDIPSGTYWVTQPQHTAFSGVLAVAEAMRSAGTAFQTQVNAQADTLSEATRVFIEETRQPGQQPNKEPLRLAIIAAETAMNSVPVNTAAVNVPNGTLWILQAAKDALQTAITTAAALRDNPAATQTEITNGVTALNSAVGVFNAAKQPGTQATTKTALTAAIAAAETARSNVRTSIAGDGTDIPGTLYWVTQAEWTALNDKITAAQALVIPTAVTQAAVDTAASDLETALASFNTQKTTHGMGTASASADYSTLITAINAAETAKNSVMVAANAIDVPSGSQWVIQTVMDDLETAITAARTVLGIPTNNQTDISTAVTALNSAVSTFNGLRTTGTQARAEDKALLIQTIAAANAAKIGVIEAASGANIAYDLYWAATAAFTALNNEIALAETAKNTAAVSVSDVQVRNTDLVQAIAVFNSAKQHGSIISVYALEAALVSAAAAKLGVVVYDTASAVSLQAGTKWVPAVTAGQNALEIFNAAITAAEAVKNSPSSQTQVNDAVTALNTAKNIFTGTIKIKANTSALDSEVASAEAARNGITVSTAAEAANRYSDFRWVTQAEWDSLNSYINAAKSVSANAASTAEQVDTARQNLYGARGNFLSNIKPGTRSAAGLIEIQFEQPGFENIDLARSILNAQNQWEPVEAEQIISRASGKNIRISLGGDLQARMWIVDGYQQYGGTKSADIYTGGLSVGYHNVTVVVQVNGLIYSKEIRFKIGN
ncbi:MAG: FIVAR domain-containing protein [Treponema sp.]|nr:FIVAR domain-containing protein [Treponema sp.]